MAIMYRENTKEELREMLLRLMSERDSFECLICKAEGKEGIFTEYRNLVEHYIEHHQFHWARYVPRAGKFGISQDVADSMGLEYGKIRPQKLVKYLGERYTEICVQEWRDNNRESKFIYEIIQTNLIIDNFRWLRISYNSWNGFWGGEKVLPDWLLNEKTRFRDERDRKAQALLSEIERKAAQRSSPRRPVRRETQLPGIRLKSKPPPEPPTPKQKKRPKPKPKAKITRKVEVKAPIAPVAPRQHVEGIPVRPPSKFRADFSTYKTADEPPGYPRNWGEMETREKAAVWHHIKKCVQNGQGDPIYEFFDDPDGPPKAERKHGHWTNPKTIHRALCWIQERGGVPSHMNGGYADRCGKYMKAMFSGLWRNIGKDREKFKTHVQGLGFD